MCVGALVHARVREVFYGAAKPKTGALVSTARTPRHPAAESPVRRRPVVCSRTNHATSSSSFSGTGAAPARRRAGVQSPIRDRYNDVFAPFPRVPTA
jgi:hypothetical protein